VLMAHRAEHEAHEVALEVQKAAREAHKPSR